MHRLRLQLAFARQFVHHGGWFAVQGVQHIAVAVGRRVGHRNAAPGQVLHEEQVKRQLLVRQAFEQGEHILTLIGGGEVVGVFNPALNAAQSGELAQVQGLHQVVGLGFGDFGEYRHGERVKAPEGLAWVGKTRIVEGEKPTMTREGLTARG